MAEKLKNIADEVLEEDELIEDEEIETGDDSEEGGPRSFLQKYSRWLIAGGVVIVLVVGFFIYRGISNRRASDKAVEAMVHPVQVYDQVMLGQASDTLLMQVINGGPGPKGPFKGMLNITKEYGSTSGGNISWYYLGTSYLRLGQIDKAIDALEKFSKGDDMISAMAYYALGAAYEEKGNWAKAAENYEAAATAQGENSKSTPLFLMAAARVYETDKKNDQAAEIYKRLMKQFPLSDEGKSAGKYLARLTGKIETE